MTDSHEVMMETTQSQDLEVVWWPIDKPTPYARNPRQAPEAAIAKVAASLQEFGFRQPIVVDEEHVVIAGHTRLLAARQLGLEQVPVHVACGLTPQQVKAYRIADNRSAQETTWDFGLLPLELTELGDLDYDLGLTGFDPAEIAGFLATDRPRASPIPTSCPRCPTSRSASLATSTCSASTACSAAMRPAALTSRG